MGGGPAQPKPLAPAYLLAGDDAARLDSALARLRARAEAEGGAAALESFGGDGGPDAAALVGALPAMSLTASRRYLLADGVERWSAGQAKAVCEALAALPPDVTVVLVAREAARGRKAPKGIAEAVAEAGGEVIRFEAPRARDLPRHLVAEAGRRGFTLELDAARVLVDRLGGGTVRLAAELDRLATWADAGGAVTREDLEAMVADTSEEAVWTLSDALAAGDASGAAAAAERLLDQGESVTPLIYAAARRLREGRLALAGMEAGRTTKQLEAELPMHPYAAKKLIGSVRERTATGLRAATCAMADLEWWTRGGSEYPDDVALSLAVARATARR